MVNFQAVQVLKALSDETRLRILRVLCREPLSVNELIDVLEMGQSRISRHLKILSDAGILIGHRNGSRIYYGFTQKKSDVTDSLLEALGLGMAHIKSDDILHLPSFAESDIIRLSRTLKERKEESLNHFQKYGFEQDRLQKEFIDSSYYRRNILNLLGNNPGVTADIGSGTGKLAEMLRGRVERLICVDQSSNLIERARIQYPETDFRIGAFEHLPLGDGEADTIIASMVLHHLPDPPAAIHEARRVLKTGGALIVADLNHHNEDIMCTKFADFWLGFKPERIHEYLNDSDFILESEETGFGRGALECIFLRAIKSNSLSRRKDNEKLLNKVEIEKQFIRQDHNRSGLKKRRKNDNKKRRL